MSIQLSPGVNVTEIDLTTVVPSVLTTAGAFAGYFRWGPVNQLTLINSEITLGQTFGVPDTNPLIDSGIPFFTAANFLAYGNNLTVVRAANTASYNSDANTAGANIQVANPSVFQYTYLPSNNSNKYGAFMGRYPGSLGNTLAVAILDTANTTQFNSWTYAGYFPSAPNTSAYTSALGGANDEIHIVVVDTLGAFSGVAGSVLETYPFVSKASDATNINDGSTNYYKQVIFNNSKYIYAVDPVDYSNTVSTWGTTAANTNFKTISVSGNNFAYFAMGGGTDVAVTDSDIINGYTQFTNKESVSVDLVLTGGYDTTVQGWVIDNISGGSASQAINSRKDCITFISPPNNQYQVINAPGNESSNIINWINALNRPSSFVVADSGWKYQFDTYNNIYRWIPLNADIAGLCVFTDSVADPWYSPAGFNRGAIKNAVKLAWNPAKTYRDQLYSAGVNPVVSFPGQGIVLFGDKTLQSKPSAFDRINVRRLFITLEKAISLAAQFSLFELNDEFTRAQFVALVTPYLRDVMGRRGITDFKVVCDTTNNTPQVIDTNRFVGDIYIKPARSINYIQLNFVAVGTGVDFSTIVGSNP